jgi:threonine aldolase
MDTVERWFASDNNAATHPLIMEALARANSGHAVGYGDDPLTQEAEASVASLFGPGYAVRFVLNGTGANVYALGCLAGHGDAIFCADCAHIVVDETGAPTAVTGAQLVSLPTVNGKLEPHVVAEAIADYGNMHKPEPRVLSLSQPTELGTVYSREELAALADLAHEHGLFLHIDGARLSNAAVALGAGAPSSAGATEGLGGPGLLRAAVADADAICFGGTKNGLMFGEAVLFSPNTLPRLRDTLRLRKTRLQLASKMRYIAAQFREYANDGLWERNARRANDMAARLASGVARLGLKPSYPVDTNAVFARIPAAVAEALRAKRFFYDWEGGIVRWMASWDTSEADVDGFLVDLEAALGAYRAGRKNLKERESAEESELSRRLARGRAFLASGWKDVDAFLSDQALGRQAPPLWVEPTAGQSVVALPEPLASGLGSASFRDITSSRKSRRSFSDAALSMQELSFLLWAAAGVKDREAANKAGAKVAFRTVPSGGCRHPLELYAYARRVTGLEPGLYRYLAKGHSLVLVSAGAGAKADEAFDEALGGQLWNSAVAFAWTALPYRSEWRYTVAAAKLVLLDAGHACQSLYGACEALGLGTCALAAYEQDKLDAALGVDGVNEFAVYAAPVGKP